MRRLILGINLVCFLLSLQAPAFSALSEAARSVLLPDALKAKIVASSKKKSLSDIDPYIPPQYLRRLALARSYAMTKAILERATGLPIVGPPWHPVKPRERAPYTATIASDRAFYDQGSSVTLSGRATDPNGFTVPNAAVTVSVISNGFTRQFNAVTDSTGNYRTGFNPSPTEAGVYNIAASHPAVVGPLVQSNFTIVGFAFQFADFTATISQNSSVNFNVALGNFGQNTITGLAYDLVELSGSGVTLTLSGPSQVNTLGAGAQTPLTFTVSASANATSAQFELTVTESHGYRRTLPITINVQPAQAAPSVLPASLTMGLVTGDVKTQVFTLKNTGFAPWTGVTLTQPTISWVTLQGNTNLGDIPPGGNASFTLAFAPPLSLSNSAFSPSPLIQIQSTNEPTFAIPANITVTTSRTGDAVFSLIDADQPCTGSQCAPVAGGTVNLVSLDISGLSFNSKADGNGVARFTGIPAGNYAWHGSSSNFQTQNGTMVLQPGISNLVNVFLPHATVTYTWSVVPTTIQDVYTVTLNLTFNTTVPAPAIVINPPVLNLNMTDGQTAFAQFSITNQGLVAADNYQLNFAGDSAMTVTLPFTSIPRIDAGQTVTVPVQITLAHASCHAGSITQNYNYTCAAGVTTQAAAQPVNITAGACGGGGGSGTTGATPTGPPSAGFGGSGGGSVSNGGGGVFSFTGNTTLIPLATPGSTPAPTCSSPSSPPPTRGPIGPCPGTDPGSGNNSGPGSGPGFPSGSPGMSAVPHWNSLTGTWTDDLNPTITMPPGGGATYTTGGGQSATFVPLGALNQPINGTGPEFAQPVDVYETLQAFDVDPNGVPGGFMLHEKDGTVTRFELFHSTPVYLPTLLTDRNGNTITYNRDPVTHNLLKVTDIHGRYIQFSYNSQNQLTGTTDSAGRTYSYTYDGSGNRNSETDANSDTTQYSYDGNHRITQITYPNSGHHTFTYTSDGKVASESDDNNNNQKSYAYFASSTAVTDALGRVTIYQFQENSGLRKISQVTDPNGGVTRFSYDQNFNLASQTDPLGHITKYQYDANGNATAITDANNQTTQTTYETTFNQPTSAQDPKGNKTQMTYDAKGNLTQIQDAQGNLTQKSYDAQGHVTSSKDPLGNVTGFTYSNTGAINSITDPLNRTTQMQRDALSRITIYADPTNNQTAFTYDNMSHVTQLEDALNGMTNFSYEPGREDRLPLELTDANNHVTSFSHDMLGRLISSKNALNQSTAINYDAKSRPTSITMRNGQLVGLSYDNLDRLIQVTLPEGNINLGYDAADNLTSASNYSNSSLAITRDNLNRATQIGQTLPNGYSANISYSYDANDNRTNMTTPFGQFTYTYDALNHLTSIVNPYGQIVTLTYDAKGRRLQTTFANSTQTNYAYDASGQLVQVVHQHVSDHTMLAFGNYSYDLAGNITTIVDANGSHTYSYDKLNRLTSANHPSAANLPIQSETFGYDPIGNRLTDAVRTGYTYDVANRIISDSSFTYTSDANGNVTSRTSRASGQKTTFIYNSSNQLTKIDAPSGVIATYKYDTIGNRIEKNVGGTITRYIYDGSRVLAILDGSNNLLMLFTDAPGIDSPLSMRRSGQDYFFHADALGNVQALTDVSGQTVETIEYEAFGRAVVKDANSQTHAQSTVGNPFLYTGTEFDPETGFNHMGLRDQDPDTGRFVQEDPLSFGAGDINLFAFVGNNPVRFTDPSGRSIDWDKFDKCVGPDAWNAIKIEIVLQIATHGIAVALTGGAAELIIAPTSFALLLKDYLELNECLQKARVPTTPPPPPHPSCNVRTP